MKQINTRGGLLKAVLPVAVLALCLLLAALMVALKPDQEKKEHTPNYPKVEVFTIRKEPVRIRISTQGNVRPRQQTTLTARVSGSIEWVAPEFYEGGSFSEGDVLLRLDPLPYESALAEAKSRLALAWSTLLQEQEAGEQARIDWQAVGAGEPTELVLRTPQLEKAKADLEAARIAVRMAEENLAYTEVRAPYEGRVEAKYVDMGQAITAQATPLGDIFSTESQEIPLALSLDDLAFMEVDRDAISGDRPLVHLSCEIAGKVHHWDAYLDRTAASLDERTRMISAYARMEPPYLSDLGETLKPGMFVRAEIEGRMIPDAARIPRGAVQPGNIAYRIEEDDSLAAVHLDMIRADSNWAIVENSLNPGDRICLTPLLIFVEGMQVEPVETDSPDGESNMDPES